MKKDGVLNRIKRCDFNFIKLTMSQFCKTKRCLSHLQTNKSDRGIVQNNQQVTLLNFLQKQSLKSHINKHGSSNFRNNKKSFLRANKTKQINLGSTGVGLKFSCRTRHQNRNGDEHHEWQKVKININSSGFDKQNRPASMNQLKYRPLSKVKAHFCNTERYESLHNFVNQEKPIHIIEQIKMKKLNTKSNKYKITKSHSRTHLSKNLVKDQKTLTEAEQFQENNIGNQKIYKENMINKKPESKRQTPNTKVNYQNNDKQELEVKDIDIFKTLLLNKGPQTTQNQDFLHSSRVQQLFDVNFSTIKLKDQSSSKFISQQIIEELIDPINNSNFLNEQKTYFHKKRKIDIDKIRKKFPQHFFK